MLTRGYTSVHRKSKPRGAELRMDKLKSPNATLFSNHEVEGIKKCTRHGQNKVKRETGLGKTSKDVYNLLL